MIALIITIIVLLILAGVALATLTGQGNIIGNAGNAVGKYNNSVTAEQQLLNEIEKHFQNYLEEHTESTEPEIVDSTDIANNPEKHFGGYVTNYTTPSGDPDVQWRIFYADESNIYLIASDYIHYDYIPSSENYSVDIGNTDYKISCGGAIIQDYTGSVDIADERIKKWISYVNEYQNRTQTNIQQVAFMLDIDIWSIKYANDYASYAVGAPTIELWCASYKKTHPEEYVVWTVKDTYGYSIGEQTPTSSEVSYTSLVNGTDNYNELYHITKTDKAENMWIASPSSFGSYSVYRISSFGSLSSGNRTELVNVGLRPIVCLNSDTNLEKISNTEYRIIENSDNRILLSKAVSVNGYRCKKSVQN